MSRPFSVWILGLIFLFGGMTPSAARAENDDMSRAQVFDVIKRNSELSDDQINRLIDDLVRAMGAENEPKIPVRGVLYTHGLNGALLVDSDDWRMNATVVDPATGELVQINDLVTAHFQNGGLKFEVAYKWMFTFVPSSMTLQQLDGGIYGRGLGATMETFIGLEGAWMPGENRPGQLFHVAIKAGFGAGLNFPKMEFRVRKIKAEKVSI